MWLRGVREVIRRARATSAASFPSESNRYTRRPCSVSGEEGAAGCRAASISLPMGREMDIPETFSLLETVS